jgi:hypothetical protein
MPPLPPWLWASAGAVPLPRPVESAPAPCPLAATAVLPGSAPPSVVYSWTTPEQIEELRQDPRLLSRTVSPVFGRTAFELALTRHAATTDDPISDLLVRPGFARQRYAWNEPWATSRGLGGEVWGSELLRVELRPESWVGTFDRTASRPWRFVDLAGEPVSQAQVLQHPERIAMVLHNHPPGDLTGALGTYARPMAAFREYVLVNEQMIARWSYGTEEIRTEVAAAARALHDTAPRLPRRLEDPQALLAELPKAWKREAPDLAEPVSCWVANLALAGAEYLPSPETAHALASGLETLSFGPPLEGRPQVTFSLEGP